MSFFYNININIDKSSTLILPGGAISRKESMYLHIMALLLRSFEFGIRKNVTKAQHIISLQAASIYDYTLKESITTKIQLKTLVIDVYQQ